MLEEIYMGLDEEKDIIMEDTMNDHGGMLLRMVTIRRIFMP